MRLVNKNTLILVDTSAVAKTGIGITRGKKLSVMLDGQEYETTAIFGLLQIFKKVSSLDNIVFCCDRRSQRKDFAEDYKSNRKENEESYIIQMGDSERGLAEAGFNVFYRDGYEADDIIAYLAKKYYNEYDKILIYTNDSDMSALCDKDCKIELRSISKYSYDINYLNYSEVLSKLQKTDYPIPFNSTALLKATVGDKSDTVKGVFRFGITSFPSLVYYAVNELGINMEEVRVNDLEEEIIKAYFQDPIQLQQALDSLRLVKPIIDGLDFEIENKKVDKSALNAFISKYEMSSILKVVAGL